LTAALRTPSLMSETKSPERLPMMKIPEQDQATGDNAGKMHPLSALTLIRSQALWGVWKWTESFSAPVLK
jgi:hypothetical protein